MPKKKHAWEMPEMPKMRELPKPPGFNATEVQCGKLFSRVSKAHDACEERCRAQEDRDSSQARKRCERLRQKKE
jgi:hypothetical protein